MLHRTRIGRRDHVHAPDPNQSPVERESPDRLGVVEIHTLRAAYGE